VDICNSTYYPNSRCHSLWVPGQQILRWDNDLKFCQIQTQHICVKTKPIQGSCEQLQCNCLPVASPIQYPFHDLLTTFRNPPRPKVRPMPSKCGNETIWNGSPSWSTEARYAKKNPQSTHRMAGVTFAIVLVIFVYKRRRRGHYRLKRSVALHIAGQMEISHTQNKKMFYIISN